MMSREEIKLVDDWFEKHTECYGTSHVNDEYTVDSYDLEAFTDFLRDNFPDLCYIRCNLGTGDENIWFHTSDLQEAKFY